MENLSPSATPFKLWQHVTQLDDTPVSISSIPGPGDVVKNAKGVHLSLGVELGSGGEGTTYETDGSLVCKVYKGDCLKQSTIDKLKLMISREIHHPAICWPVSLAYNSCDEPVGYLMPRAQGRELQPTIFIPSRLQQTFPHWTRRHLVKLTSTILAAVDYLHSLNVLLGDINARNILVQDESTVFFVDCDSYQVEGFPCPVGMPPFLAPELYGKEFRSTLRTLEHEYFAIATLVFMLLHLGKSPYSHQGGEDPSKNVQTQHFPYQRGDRGAQGAPMGAWRFMFSHLPRYMKDAFHEVFSDGKRLSTDTWQGLMQRYENDLYKKYVSDDLFPSSFKQLTKEQVEKQEGTWRSCEYCGQDFGAFKDEERICPKCRSLHHNHNQTRDEYSKRQAEPRLTQHTPDPRDDRFMSNLFFAAAGGDEEGVQLALNAGADPNALAEDKTMPLHAAVQANHYGIVCLLLEAGASPRCRDGYGYTPLHLARIPMIACALLEAGANVNARDKKDCTPLSHALMRGDSPVIDVLARAGGRLF